VQYLRAEEILCIHDQLVETHGGIFGIRDQNLLFSVAERPRTSMMGKEFYPDVFLKAAALFEGIATYHVFTDGNKRTAFLTMSVFLGVNGYDLHATNKEAFSYTLEVALKKRSIEQIAAWLKRKSTKA